MRCCVNSNFLFFLSLPFCEDITRCRKCFKFVRTAPKIEKRRRKWSFRLILFIFQGLQVKIRHVRASLTCYARCIVVMLFSNESIFAVVLISGQWGSTSENSCIFYWNKIFLSRLSEEFFLLVFFYVRISLSIRSYVMSW